MLLTQVHKAGCGDTNFPNLVYKGKKVFSLLLLVTFGLILKMAVTQKHLKIYKLTLNPTSVTRSGKKALVFLHNKDWIIYAVVCLAPRSKKVSINPRVIFDVHLNLNSSGRLVFLCRAEWLQNIFAVTDLCDGPSSTLVFAACAKSVPGWPHLLKNHFSHEGCSSTSRYAWMF